MSQPVEGPLTHRRVLKIALPIMIANATVPILGAVDTGVVGQMGEAAPIGAVGIGAIILSAFYWLFGFLRMGTVGLTSQAHGAGDGAEVAALLSRSLMIGLAAGVVLILLQAPLFWGAFQISPASAEVESLARGYMARENRDHTLQPTALVHEAYFRRVDQTRVNWRGRSHFRQWVNRNCRPSLARHQSCRIR